jgi:hypothetical protein
MIDRKDGLKMGKVGGYTAAAAGIASVLPGVKDLPIEVGAFLVAALLRGIEAIVRKKFKIDLFG